MRTLPANTETARTGAQGPHLLIDRILAGAPSRRVLDLGCGVGRQARLLARQGCEVVAIDASEAALEQARAEPVPEGVEFLLGDMGAVERMVRGHFGAALCLGNTLPYLLSPESLSRMFIGLKRRLLPGAPFLFQVLNYDRILAGGKRAQPVEFVEAPDGELLVVRLMEPREDGIVLHTTSTLRYRPTREPMMEVVAILHVGWQDKRRVHGTTLHIDVIGDKVWIQYDGTDPGVARELVEAGIPREAIVLGFRPPHVRPHTGFAVG